MTLRENYELYVITKDRNLIGSCYFFFGDPKRTPGKKGLRKKSTFYNEKDFDEMYRIASMPKGLETLLIIFCFYKTKGRDQNVNKKSIIITIQRSQTMA